MSDPQTPQEQAPVRIGRRIVLALVGLVVGVAVVGYMGHRANQNRLADEVRRLEQQLDEKDPHWRLADIEARREEVPDEENSARLIVDVTGQVNIAWPPPKFTERLDLENLHTPQRLDPDRARLLAAEMKPLASVVASARKLADMPRGRYALKHAFNPLMTLTPDIHDSHRAAALLHYDALDLAFRGDIDAALRSCRAALNVGRAAGDEPIVVSQMIRCAIIHQAIFTAERVLAQGAASEKTLVELQELLTLEDQHPTLRIARRGERATLADLCDKLASGQIDMPQMRREFNVRPPDLWEGWSGDKTTRRDHILVLRALTEAVAALDLPEAAQPAEELRIDSDLVRLKLDPLVSALVSPRVSPFGTVARRKQAYVRCLLALVAAERFRLHNKRWPETLEELAPRWMPRLTVLALVDPLDGKALRYKKLEDGVVVYSIGENGSDDGGNIQRNNPLGGGVDWGVRLWDVEARGQSAPPGKGNGP